MGDPVHCAKMIGTALTARWPHSRYRVGYDAQALALWSSITPTAVKGPHRPHGHVALRDDRP